MKKVKKEEQSAENRSGVLLILELILVLFVVGFVLKVLVLVEKGLFSLVNVIGVARLADEIVLLVVNIVKTSRYVKRLCRAAKHL